MTLDRSPAANRTPLVAICTGLLPPAVEARGIRAVYALLTELAGLGYPIHLVTSAEFDVDPHWPAWAKDQRAKGVHVYALPGIRRGGLRAAHTALLQLRLSAAAARLTRRYPSGVIHEFGSNPLMAARVALVRPRRWPSIYTWTTHSCRAAQGLWKRLRPRWPRPSLLVCTGHDQFELALSTYGHGARILELPLGLDPARTVPASNRWVRQRAKIGSECSVVGYINPPTPSKGALVFAAAAQRLVREGLNVRFVVVTHPQAHERRYRGQLAALQAEMGVALDRTTWMEGTTDIADLLRSLDILAMPLTTLAGTFEHPQLLLESLAVGVATVTTDLPGVRELTLDGRLAALVPPNDVDALVRQISGLSADPRRRQELGRQARQHMRSYPTVRGVAERLDAEYARLTAMVSPMGR